MFCVDHSSVQHGPSGKGRTERRPTLLSYDNAREALERNGWHIFIEKFKSFNLQVAQEFSLTFDGCREKIVNVQLEVTEEFIS